MLTKEQFHDLIGDGVRFLDGATGSNLRLAGMPKDACAELWCLDHPDVITELQRRYYEAGSEILYAPTFQAQPIALERYHLEDNTESINAKLVALSRSAAPGALIAGDLTTLAALLDVQDPNNIDLMVENYRRQIHGLMDGGADLLVAETLIHPMEAEAIQAAAELEGAGAVMFSFTMFSEGTLFPGMDAGPVLRELEQSGAAAVGFNCVIGDMMTPYLVRTLRKYVRGPLLCKPNAGTPVIREDGVAEYSMGSDEFAQIMHECRLCGGTLLGGCCGTDPEFIRKMIQY